MAIVKLLLEEAAINSEIIARRSGYRVFLSEKIK